MNRRGFLTGILLTGSAPAIVKFPVMRVRPIVDATVPELALPWPFEPTRAWGSSLYVALFSGDIDPSNGMVRYQPGVYDPSANRSYDAFPSPDRYNEYYVEVPSRGQWMVKSVFVRHGTMKRICVLSRESGA